jgi:hypothetical protein
MNENQKRRRRDQRQANPPAMHLTERDKAIVEAVHRYRLLRQDQVQALFFGSPSAAQRVLVRLYDHGFLERRFIPVYSGRSPTFYVLDRRGAELLRAERGYDELNWHHSSKDLSSDFLEHTLAINDVRIAVTKAAQQPGYALLEWRSESDLKADYDRVTLRTSTGRARAVSIVPDSYFVVQTPLGRAPFFLEVDRGTETITRFLTKVRAYVAYYASGGYERRFGSRSLRILTVTTGAQRRDNLCQATASATHERRFYFAQAADLRAKTIFVQPVWCVAGEPLPRALVEENASPSAN